MLVKSESTYKDAILSLLFYIFYKCKGVIGLIFSKMSKDLALLQLGVFKIGIQLTMRDLYIFPTIKNIWLTTYEKSLMITFHI